MGKMRGAFNLRELGETLPSTNPNGSLPQVMLEGSPFGLRSQNQIDHDVKIGAAGELFVGFLLFFFLPCPSRCIIYIYIYTD